VWQSVTETSDLLTALIPKKPTDLHAQHLSERPKFVIKNISAIGLDLGDSSSVELDPYTREPAGESVLS
jgi:hypothetical protein